MAALLVLNLIVSMLFTASGLLLSGSKRGPGEMCMVGATGTMPESQCLAVLDFLKESEIQLSLLQMPQKPGGESEQHFLRRNLAVMKAPSSSALGNLIADTLVMAPAKAASPVSTTVKATMAATTTQAPTPASTTVKATTPVTTTAKATAPPTTSLRATTPASTTVPTTVPASTTVKASTQPPVPVMVAATETTSMTVSTTMKATTPVTTTVRATTTAQATTTAKATAPVTTTAKATTTTAKASTVATTTAKATVPATTTVKATTTAKATLPVTTIAKATTTAKASTTVAATMPVSTTTQAPHVAPAAMVIHKQDPVTAAPTEAASTAAPATTAAASAAPVTAAAHLAGQGEYIEQQSGNCAVKSTSSVNSTTCQKIASERGFTINMHYKSKLNPRGCFVHYDVVPHGMFFNNADSDEECTAGKTCICDNAPAIEAAKAQLVQSAEECEKLNAKIQKLQDLQGKCQERETCWPRLQEHVENVLPRYEALAKEKGCEITEASNATNATAASNETNGTVPEAETNGTVPEA